MADTHKAFVTGFPIKHSRSPLIHGYWLKKHGIDGTYEAVEVHPDAFAAFLVDLQKSGYAGGNVTLPHKEAAFAAVERRDTAAQAIGAINTLWFEDGILCGGNTDAIGFAANLDEQIPQWRDAGHAMVFGAGGAARAILHALLEAGMTVDLVNRTLERAQDLAHRFGDRVNPITWQDAASRLPHADLLVNSTSLGMSGQPDFPLDLASARSDALASDIVYIPLETPFLSRARQAGLKTSDGLGMLLHQAVPGFEHWFGIRPQVDAQLRDIILADIEKGQPR